MESQRVFDATKEFEVHIQSGGKKSCVLRYPNDEEWKQRAAKMVTIVHNLGRDKTRSEVPNADHVDAELFARLRIDKDGPEYDEHEASAFMDRIARAEIEKVTREGDNYRMQMTVPGAVVEHVLKTPLRGDLDAYSAAALVPTACRRHREIRVNLEPTETLYAKAFVSASGYADVKAIPIRHKDAAVVELIAQIRALEDEDPEA